MNKSAALFISVILLTQIASYSFNEVQSDSTSESTLQDDSNWDVSGRNNSTGNNSNSNNDSHCLNVGNFSINSTYFVAIDLINTCNFGINYPGINASADNSGVSGFYNGTSWWYVLEANGTYIMSAQLEFDSSVLNGTIITLDFEASVLNCGTNGTWHDCPDSQNATLAYQFTFGNNSSSDNNTGGNDTGNNTDGNGSTGNNTTDNNSTATIPNYYFDESYGLNFNSVSNIMNGTYVPTTVLIHNYDNNSTTIDHMLAVTFYSDGHSEQKTTQYLVPPVSRNTISVSQYVYITSETTYVEVSMDVLECTDEYCDMSKTPEDRYYPADYQYYQSYSSTYIPRVVELTDEIYDLDDGEDIPRFTFEMEEIDWNGEMYYSIVVTSSQMNFATQCMEIIIHWIDANGESQMANWNLAYENGVYGFYPGNSNSTVTFADSVDSGDSATSSFGVGDNIFIKSEIENQIFVGAIRISYAPDDTTGIILRSWDVGGFSIIVDDNDSEDNTDDNDTEDDSESSGLPSIGMLGTLAAIAVSFVAVIRREQEE
ncbi:hypothetical protein OAO34_06490 [Candidatus Poseidoniaceae archaeon]|nr:hypothetical protein [Candidatus Poseidoniaceae archaeon]